MTQALVGLFAGAILAGAGQIILFRRDRATQRVSRPGFFGVICVSPRLS